MATIVRIQVLLREAPAGVFTATAVDLPAAPVVVATSQRDALKEMDERLEKHFEEHPWADRLDYEGFELAELRHSARPEYTNGERVFPCPETIPLRLTAVLAREPGGLGTCQLPALGLSFSYAVGAGWRPLAEHFAGQHLRGLTPAALIRLAAPVKAALHNRPIRRPALWQRSRESAAVPKALAAVADPLPGEGAAARRLGTAWERAEQVIELLARLTREQASILLVGEPGCGKSTILADATRRLARSGEGAGAEDEEAGGKKRSRFWRTNAARLIAGMKYLGQWEQRCEEVIAALGEFQGVLCAESLLDLVRVGGQTPRDSIAAFLLPYLQRGELRLVAEATPAELEACRRLLPGFADAFQILRVPEFSRAAALKVLEKMRDQAERDLHLEVEQTVPAVALQLFRRFQPGHAFPGRTTRFFRDLLKRHSARSAVRPVADGDHAQFSKETHSGSEAGRTRSVRSTLGNAGLTANDVRTAFSLQSGLPDWLLRDDFPLAEDEVFAQLCARVIGQPAACRIAAGIVSRFKAGLNDPARPLAVQLFCGPTGVGKTALARALAEYLFGADPKAGEARLIRLDLSEYAVPGSARRLITADDGGPSELVKRVRAQPLCVVLFDEVEKADAEVFDVLLGLFDEGRLTDPFGKVTDFRSAVVLLTSNLGADRPPAMGFGASGRPAFAEAVAQHFRPEFFNRLDGVVEFRPLSAELVREIAAKELRELSRREGLQLARLTFEPGATLIEEVAKAGFDPRYGARPLQRAVEELVVAPLAKWLLEHPPLHGKTVRGEWRGGRVEFGA